MRKKTKDKSQLTVMMTGMRTGELGCIVQVEKTAGVGESMKALYRPGFESWL